MCQYGLVIDTRRRYSVWTIAAEGQISAGKVVIVLANASRCDKRFSEDITEMIELLLGGWSGLIMATSVCD